MARSRALGKRSANTNANGDGTAGTGGEVRGATLEPVGVVRRELVSPAGDVVIVDVPVYPPFRLETPAERTARGGSGGRGEREGADPR